MEWPPLSPLSIWSILIHERNSKMTKYRLLGHLSVGANLPLKGPLAHPALRGSVGWQGPWPLTSGRVREDILPQAPGGQLIRAVRSSEGQFNLRTISSCKILINQSESESEVAQSCPTLCDPMDSRLHRAPLSMGFSSKSTGVGCHFLLQGIFRPRD